MSDAPSRSAGQRGASLDSPPLPYTVISPSEVSVARLPAIQSPTLSERWPIASTVGPVSVATTREEGRLALDMRPHTPQELPVVSAGHTSRIQSPVRSSMRAHVLPQSSDGVPTLSSGRRRMLGLASAATGTDGASSHVSAPPDTSMRQPRSREIISSPPPQAAQDMERGLSTSSRQSLDAKYPVSSGLRRGAVAQAVQRFAGAALNPEQTERLSGQMARPRSQPSSQLLSPASAPERAARSPNAMRDLICLFESHPKSDRAGIASPVSSYRSADPPKYSSWAPTSPLECVETSSLAD